MLRVLRIISCLLDRTFTVIDFFRNLSPKRRAEKRKEAERQMEQDTYGKD